MKKLPDYLPDLLYILSAILLGAYMTADLAGWKEPLLALLVGSWTTTIAGVIIRIINHFKQWKMKNLPDHLYASSAVLLAAYVTAALANWIEPLLPLLVSSGVLAISGVVIKIIRHFRQWNDTLVKILNYLFN